MWHILVLKTSPSIITAVIIPTAAMADKNINRTYLSSYYHSHHFGLALTSLSGRRGKSQEKTTL
jgi:hypothetical protein